MQKADAGSLDTSWFDDTQDQHTALWRLGTSPTQLMMKAQPADELQTHIMLAAHLLLWVAPSKTAMLLPNTALVAKDMLAGRLWPLVHLS